MATDEEVKAAGFYLPQDTDYVYKGAATFRANAHAAFDYIKQQATVKADNALAEAKDYARTFHLSDQKIQRNLIKNEDLDNFRDTGDYLVPNSATALTLANYPTAANKTVALLKVRTTTAGFAYQRLEIFGSEPAIFYRGIASIASKPFPWAPWKRLLDESSQIDLPASIEPDNSISPVTKDPSTAAVRNALMVQDFTRRYRVSTGGKAAVAFRFDHGLKNFSELILPIMRANKWPCAQIINSRNWGYAENAGITADTVNSWVLNDQVEIWNHSATHGNATTRAELEREIVDGLIELREQIPAASIDGWAVPGVKAQGPYMGMGTGTAYYQFSASIAGQLILANHAVSTGHIAGTHRRFLDGVPRNGMHHFGIDSRTSLAPVKTEIDAVIQAKQGLQIFLHPSVIGKDGYTTAAVMKEIFDYIAAKEKAGELVILSPYQLLAATL